MPTVKRARLKAAEAAPSRPPRAYTYARYSSPQQGGGSSIARQDAYAERWAKENGLTLDRSLRMADLGKSAFSGEHLKPGSALAAFMLQIKNKDVLPGDALIVENLDRLSRAEPIDSQGLFGDIVRAGVAIVTSNDNQVYSRETLRQNRALLLVVDALWMRAHEESDSKSVRIRAAYRDKVKKWNDGERDILFGAPRHMKDNGKGELVLVPGTDPSWVLYNREAKRFELDQPQADAMVRMIELYRAGYGAVEITRRLAAEGLSVSEKYPTNRIQRVISYPALKGDKVVISDGKEFVLRGYYPPLMNESEWDELQLLVGKRGHRKGKGDVPAILTGLKTSYCGYCRMLLVGQTVTKKLADGTERKSRRLRCGTYYHLAQKCEGGDSWRAEPVERALLTVCADQANLDYLFSGNDKADPLMKQLTAKRAALAKLELRIKGIKDALRNSDESPETFLETSRELEAEKRDLTKVVEQLERELKVHTCAKPSTGDAWAALTEEAMALDYDARMKARLLVSETFERIDVFAKGLEPKAKHGLEVGARTMHLRLTSKRGVVLGFDFDRRTGELLNTPAKVPNRERIATGKHSTRSARTK
ncbi:recombinase family protein [Paraburkholderia mimosarum]|uniref:recombinase family protein n=1 Tax=Paraburkholderia mimosarum TaxID=312026 RepID=UPI00041DF195|nr:recombinase family protein [Paraburkholderia mimosarum]